MLSGSRKRRQKAARQTKYSNGPSQLPRMWMLTPRYWTSTSLKSRPRSVRLSHPRLYSLEDGDANAQDKGFLAGLPSTKDFPDARITAREASKAPTELSGYGISKRRLHHKKVQ